MEEEGAGFSIERAVRQSLYWPDGTIRKRTKSYIAKKSHNQRCLIAQALVDKYNEDYILLKVCSPSLPLVFLILIRCFVDFLVLESCT